jgi:predicted transcriptional regulator
MTETEARILELFQTLAPDEQRALVERLSGATPPRTFYERLTPRQRAQLDEGIAQAEAGDVAPAAEVFDRLAKRFGFSKG